MKKRIAEYELRVMGWHISYRQQLKKITFFVSEMGSSWWILGGGIIGANLHLKRMTLIAKCVGLPDLANKTS